MKSGVASCVPLDVLLSVDGSTGGLFTVSGVSGFIVGTAIRYGNGLNVMTVEDTNERETRNRVGVVRKE